MSARNAAFWIGLLVVLAVVLALLDPILPPFVAGLAIAYLLDPLVGRVERLGVRRIPATGLVAAAFFIGAVVLIIVLVPILQTQLVDLSDRLVRASIALYDRAKPWADSMLARFGGGGIARIGGTNELAPRAVQWVMGFVGSLVGGGLALFNIVSLLFVTPVVSYYLMRDWPRVVARVDVWLPRDHAAEIRLLARRIDDRMAGFVRGQAMVCVFLATFYGVALAIVGLDNGLLVGLLTGLLSFIPYVGIAVGMASGVLIAAFQYDNLLSVGIVLGVFMVGQFIEAGIVTPRLVGERVGLHPVWIIFAIMAGGALFGFSGVLLAVPAAAALGELFRFGLEKYLAGPIYAGRGAATGERDPRMPLL